jgi:adenylate cyclase
VTVPRRGRAGKGDACDTGATVLWLADGAVSAPAAENVLTELCDRLVASGVPLWRSAVFIRTLHPEFLGRQFRWIAGQGTEVLTAPFALSFDDDYLQSPVVRVYRDKAPIRRRILDADCPMDFSILKDFRAQGGTDYLAVPLNFSNGEVHAATWTTRAEGGFSDAAIAGIAAVTAPLARVAEVRALRRTTTNLLDAYLGRQAGESILGGRIRRGDTEKIHAAIWLSDMRGFTTLADRVDPSDLIALLNRFFDCQAPPIHDQGGEILKFIGDGLLAIFPIAPGADPADVCGRAFAAAMDARARIGAMEGVADDSGPVRFGLALHVGEALYGNIGGGGRLDFTCIGPAINMAARLEKLASRLGRSIIASSAFASHAPGAFAPLGEFAMQGFRLPQMAFGLVAEDAPT